MGKKKKFEDFLREKKKDVENRDALIQTTKERIEKWKSEINNLYKIIKEWLNPFSETINTQTVDFIITEEMTGSYGVDALILKIGKEEIILEPRGTYMLGSSGRIDIRGKNNTYILALTELDDKKKIDEKWIIVDKIDRMKRKKLSKETFQELIQELSE